MIFGAFMPLVFELTSEALKSCTPNMKKKKDPSFDELKNKVLKPLKECISIVKNHFGQCSSEWNNRSQTDLLSLEEGTDEVNLIRALDFEGKIMTLLKEKRLSQINKEYKATNDRFKDLNDKISKKYATL